MKTCILFAMIVGVSGLKIGIYARPSVTVEPRFKGVSTRRVRSPMNLRPCSTEPGKEPLRDAWSDFLAQSGAYRSSQSTRDRLAVQSRADLGLGDGLGRLTGARFDTSSCLWGKQWIICIWRRLVGVVRAILVLAALVATIILGDPARTQACAATVAGAQQPSRVELVAPSDSDVHENVACGHEHGSGAVEDCAAYVQPRAECESDIRGLQPYTEIIRFLETVVVDERMQSAEPWEDGSRDVEYLSGTERHRGALWLILQVACAAVGGGLIALGSTGSQGCSDDLRLRFHQPTPAVSLLSAYTFIGSAARDATFGYSYVGTHQEGSAPQGAGGLALGSVDPLLCAAFSSVCFTLGFVIACVF
jgi:hypothetical protein